MSVLFGVNKRRSGRFTLEILIHVDVLDSTACLMRSNEISASGGTMITTTSPITAIALTIPPSRAQKKRARRGGEGLVKEGGKRGRGGGG